jgi:hypothetical protein
VRWWQREPVLVIALVEAILGLALAFGIDVSEEQMGAILVAVNAGLALLARSQVSPSAYQPRRVAGDGKGLT